MYPRRRRGSFASSAYAYPTGRAARVKRRPAYRVNARLVNEHVDFSDDEDADPRCPEEERYKHRSTCCVCSEDFKDGEDVTKRRCNHIFHTTCIREWFDRSGKTTCPECRDDGGGGRAEDV